MTDEEQDRKWRPKLWGICLSLISGTVLLAMNAIVQKMKLHFADVLFTRAVFQSFLGLVLSLYRGESVWIKEVDDGQNLYQMRILLFLFGLFNSYYFHAFGRCHDNYFVCCSTSSSIGSHFFEGEIAIIQDTLFNFGCNRNCSRAKAAFSIWKFIGAWYETKLQYINSTYDK